MADIIDFSEQKTIRRRRKIPEGVDYSLAIRVLREFAHARGLVVAGPCRLLGRERTGYGDSDKMEEGPISYRLVNKDFLFEGLGVGDKDRKVLEAVADTLLDYTDWDIKDCKTRTANLKLQDDERGRWSLVDGKGYIVGVVVRTGEGSSKRYMLFLWNGEWKLWEGPPPFDLPLFGQIGDGHSVMIHEGPKARAGAERMSRGKLQLLMDGYSHVGWHGSDAGIEWTDWTPLRGKKVLIWPDMDYAGRVTAHMLALHIAKITGEVVQYVRWIPDDIEASPAWDWADPMTPRIQRMTRYDIMTRVRGVESPFDRGGRVHGAWADRSYVDRAKQMVYQEHNRYQEAFPLAGFNTECGPTSARKVLRSPIQEYMGTTYLPGKSFGQQENGKINVCPMHSREPIEATPLGWARARLLLKGWLMQMIPDVRQRKWLIRRMALAVARPEWRSQHMVVMRGDSGIGKSVLLNLLAAVIGEDRAAAIMPDSIFKNFNETLKNKSTACLHEIHSSEMTRKQNAGRLKELIGNDTLIIYEKYKSAMNVPNVINWFGATNEKVPFAMAHGNDRFYFVECVGWKKGGFFRKHCGRLLEDSSFHDELYAAAKYLVANTKPSIVDRLLSRAPRQEQWKEMENLSLSKDEQKVKFELDQLAETIKPGDWMLFYGDDVVRLMGTRTNMGPDSIRLCMNNLGYQAIREGKYSFQRLDKNTGRRQVVWGRSVDRLSVIRCGRLAELKVYSLLGSQGDPQGKPD